MLGFMREELKGKVFTEFTHPDDVELDMGQFNELILGKKDHYMIKKRYIRKNRYGILGQDNRFPCPGCKR